MTSRSACAFAVSWLLVSVLCADEIVLSSGITLKGQVVERNSKQVVIVSSGRKIAYKASEVGTVKLDPLPEFEEGQKLLAEGNVAAAIRAFEKVLNGDRVLFQEDARAKLVFCYFRTGRPGDAVAAFLEMLRKAPDSRHRSGFPWHYEGELTAPMQIRKTIAEARKTVNLAPALDAWVSLVAGETAGAQKQISALVQSKDPVTAGIGTILQLRLLFESGKLVEYTRLVAEKKWTARDDVWAWIWYWEGRRLMAEKDYPRAALALLHAPAVYPENECLAGDCLYLVGQCFEKMNQKDRARNEYAALMSQFPIALAADQARKRIEVLK
ncbi:MAG: tetratricopeptide repeat protein [Planctomycetota bacterium]